MFYPLRNDYSYSSITCEMEGMYYEQKEVPATVVACAAVVTVGGPGFCRGATCRVRSGSMSLFECHNIYTKLGELEEGPHRGRCLQLHWPDVC